MKKLFYHLLIAVVVVSIVFMGFGCKAEEVVAPEEAVEEEAVEETSTEVEAEPVSITLAHIFTEGIEEPDERTGIDAIKRFEADNPNVNIVQDISPHDNYLVKIKTLAAGDELPNLFFVNGSMVTSFSEAGLMRPFNEMLNAESEWASGFSEGSFDEFTIDGNIYATKVTPIVKTKYLLSYSYTFILETIRSLLKYISAGGQYPRAECSLSLL